MAYLYPDRLVAFEPLRTPLLEVYFYSHTVWSAPERTRPIATGGVHEVRDVARTIATPRSSTQDASR